MPKQMPRTAISAKIKVRTFDFFFGVSAGAKAGASVWADIEGSCSGSVATGSVLKLTESSAG